MLHEKIDLKKIALFYTGEWHCFDPFSAYNVEYNGRVWMTVEHAYQAARFVDTSIVDKIYNASSPYMAKEIARKEKINKQVIVSDWETQKLEVMRELIRLKIEQHPDVRKKLLESGDLLIVEDSPTDSYWGRGEDWNGQNNLGKLWMEKREELRKEILLK